MYFFCMACDKPLISIRNAKHILGLHEFVRAPLIAVSFFKDLADFVECVMHKAHSVSTSESILPMSAF